MSGRRLWSWTAIALVAWGVLALGATRPWGYLPLLAGMATYGAATFLKREGRSPVSRGLCFSLTTLCGAVFLQLIPLPVKLLGVINPAMAPIAGIQGGAATPAGHASLNRWALSRPLSIDPNATALGLACVLAFALFFVGIVRTMGPDGARRLAAGLVGLGTIVALVGIAESNTPWGGIYHAAGLRLPPDSTPHGPFSSKNHYAGWMLMTLALTMGYLCAAFDPTRMLSHAGPQSLVSRLRRAVTGRMLAVQCAATAMAVALIQTRSRGGILCLVLAIVTLGGLLIRRCASTRSRILVTGPLVLLLLTGIVVTGVRPIAERFVAASWSTANGRLPIWRQAVAIAQDFPITGSGFNTYQTIVPLYVTPDLDEPYEGAHNDFLQLAAEGGLLLGLPVLATLGFFVWETRQRFRESSNDRTTKWLRIGAVVGLSLMAVQETVDFNLQIPGNAALFVVLAAIAVHRTPAELPQL
jgi:putative inorganic carbon (HCO3(-)) transporter